MKKWLVGVVTALSLMIAAPSFACEGPDCEGNQVQAMGSYDAEAWDYDDSYSRSNWGWGNDVAYAEGNSMIGAELKTGAFAEGCEYDYEYMGNRYGWGRLNPWNYRQIVTPNEAFEQGLILGWADTDAWSYAKDFGLTSIAGAGVYFDKGGILIEGFAKGEGWKDEYAKSVIKFGGDMYQCNLAQEVGYDAGGVFAENMSGLSFRAYTPWKVNVGDDAVVHFNGTGYTPTVFTEGHSYVNIDPYGNFRSIEAHTSNISKVSFNGCGAPDITSLQSGVHGNGIVSGVISNGSAFAGGTATFGYTGHTFGTGEANLSAEVNNFGNGGTQVMVSGNSSAVANGYMSQDK